MLQSLPGLGMRFPYIQVQVLKQLILGRSTRVANNLKPQHNGLDARMVLDTSWESFLRFLRIVCPAVVLVNSAIFFKFPFPSFKAEEQTTKTTTKNWIWASLIHVMLCIYVCMCIFISLHMTNSDPWPCLPIGNISKASKSLHANKEFNPRDIWNDKSQFKCNAYLKTIQQSRFQNGWFRHSKKKIEICTQFTLKNWKIMFETIGCRILYPTFGTSYIPCNGTQFLA